MLCYQNVLIFTKLIQSVIFCDGLFTEIGLGYLSYKSIPVKLYICLVHRIVVWFSLLISLLLIWWSWKREKLKMLYDNELHSLTKNKRENFSLIVSIELYVCSDSYYNRKVPNTFIYNNYY